MNRRPFLFRAVGVLFAVALTTAVAPSVAQAAAPCWKQVLDDWYDGTIDRTYAVPCYGQAIAHLPFDTRLYSTAETDIRSALYETLRARGIGSSAPTNGEDRRLMTTGSVRRLESESRTTAAKSAITPVASTKDTTAPPLTLLLGAVFAALLMISGGVRYVVARRRALRARLERAGGRRP